MASAGLWKGFKWPDADVTVRQASLWHSRLAEAVQGSPTVGDAVASTYVVNRAAWVQLQHFSVVQPWPRLAGPVMRESPPRRVTHLPKLD